MRNVQWSTQVTVVWKLVKSSLNCHKIKAPIITTGKNFEAFEWNHEGLTVLLTVLVETSQPAVVFEACHQFFPGSTSHLLKFTKPSRTRKFIQGYRPTNGKRQCLDASTLGDAGQESNLTKWTQLSLLHGGVQTLRITKTGVITWTNSKVKLKVNCNWPAKFAMQSTNMLIKTLSINRRRWHYSNIYSSPSHDT